MFVGEEYQKVEVELEVTGKLEEELVDTVQPLEEHGAPLVGVGTGRVLATAVAESVAKSQPLSLHQHLEPLQAIHTFVWDTLPVNYVKHTMCDVWAHSTCLLQWNP